MKYSVFAFLLFIILMIACKPSGSKEVTIAPEILTSTDSSAIVPQTDSTQVDPKTHETAMQQDPPAEELKTAAPKVCNPSFKSLAVPKKNHHIIYVSGFKASEFKCWSLLEDHGIKVCGDNPCVIYFVDEAEVKTNATGPDYIDANTLMRNGIGRFESKNKHWEIKGANVWKRAGKDYGYYSSSQY